MLSLQCQHSCHRCSSDLPILQHLRSEGQRKGCWTILCSLPAKLPIVCRYQLECCHWWYHVHLWLLLHLHQCHQRWWSRCPLCSSFSFANHRLLYPSAFLFYSIGLQCTHFNSYGCVQSRKHYSIDYHSCSELLD